MPRQRLLRAARRTEGVSELEEGREIAGLGVEGVLEVVDGLQRAAPQDGVQPLEVVLLGHPLVLLAQVSQPARHHLRDAAHGEPEGEAQEPGEEGQGQHPGRGDADTEKVEGCVEDGTC